ncbi:polysaccharide pyruvyl transferase family protein [Caldibacillus thermoamylovorans]
MQNNNILIMGASLNSGNRGVNALTRGAINGLTLQKEDVSIKLLSFSTRKVINHEVDGNKIEEIPFRFLKSLPLAFLTFIPFFPKGLFRRLVRIYFPKLWEILEWADIVLDISEGDSFSDIYGFKRMLMHSSYKLISSSYGKKIILLPQTIGPFSRNSSKLIARKIFKLSNKVLARDKLSYNLLKSKFNINEDKIGVFPDLAFNMNPSQEFRADSLIFSNKNEIIGINVSGLLYNGGYSKNNMFGFRSDYKELLQEIIEYLIENTEYNILLVPHVITSRGDVEDDITACQNIYALFSQYKNRINIIDQEYREDELKYIISCCKLFVGGRMHACIAAISTNVITIPIAYSRKFIGVWELFGLENMVADPRIQTKTEIIKIVDESIKNSNNILKIIKDKNREFKNQLSDLFGKLLIK